MTEFKAMLWTYWLMTLGESYHLPPTEKVGTAEALTHKLL